MIVYAWALCWTYACYIWQRNSIRRQEPGAWLDYGADMCDDAMLR